jgi:hypothetical protein
MRIPTRLCGTAAGARPLLGRFSGDFDLAPIGQCRSRFGSGVIGIATIGFTGLVEGLDRLSNALGAPSRTHRLSAGEHHSRSPICGCVIRRAHTEKSSDRTPKVRL